MFDAVRQHGVQAIALRGTSGSLKLGRSTAGSIAALCRDGARIASIGRSERVDVVHANSIRAGLMGCVSERLPGAAPTVVHLHDALPPGTAATAVARAVRRGTTALAANSRFTAERFAPGDASVAVVFNPIDMAHFEPKPLEQRALRELAGLHPTAPMFGVIAQITPWKGQIDAIRALARIRSELADARLVVAGSPKFVASDTRYDNLAYEGELHSVAEQAGVADAVDFLGERSDVPELLQALDVVAMPSWEEPFGRIAVEAMAMGVAVVATSVGGPPEYIEHGVSGLLCPPRDPEALAEAVLSLLTDTARRADIARAGQGAVRTRFATDAYVERMLDVYRSMASARA